MQARDSKIHSQSSLHMALNISFGFNHLHEENYTQGDMKPCNELLTSDFNLILQRQDASKRF